MRKLETAMLVDDDDAFRTMLQSALRRRGVRARTAATVDEGLIALEDEPADLVVLDFKMPQGDGLQALERYRRKHADTVIMMLTGYGDIPLAVAAVRKGADLFLTKPIDADRLVREAEAVLREPRGAPHLPTVTASLNLDEMERDAIAAALKQCGGVIAQAAKVLGIDRRTLQRKLRKID
jgi:two-component system response regulator RegA